MRKGQGARGKGKGVRRKAGGVRRKAKGPRRKARVTRIPQAAPLRWNPDPDDVQRSVVRLVLSLVEFIRKLMERQAIRRAEAETLTAEEIENVGRALMELEKTVQVIARRFKISLDDLNIDLGPLGNLH